MIAFKTNMKELPKSCNDCELFDKMCKLSFKILRYKKERYKYCPLVNIEIEKPILLDVIDKSNEIKSNDEYNE
jgi:hypothetical protein